MNGNQSSLPNVPRAKNVAVLPLAEKLIYSGMIGFAPFLLASHWLPVDKASGTLATALGTLVIGTGATLVTLGGRIMKLALGFRPVLRIALDVDNWLREHPRDSNPTARICARYVSLLRFIAQWQDRDGHRYDGLIIFAHSQGTVISADLLRFLQRTKDPALERLDTMPVFLFTFGCPLRQLYAQRFPHLYAYAGGKTGPDPRELGVAGWVNAYRSGDYVGRYLWNSGEPFIALDEADRIRWRPWSRPVPTQGGHDEFCIGTGAHTHYWDRTAPAIGKAFDGLIGVI